MTFEYFSGHDYNCKTARCYTFSIHKSCSSYPLKRKSNLLVLWLNFILFYLNSANFLFGSMIMYLVSIFVQPESYLYFYSFQLRVSIFILLHFGSKLKRNAALLGRIKYGSIWQLILIWFSQTVSYVLGRQPDGLGVFMKAEKSISTTCFP